MKNGRKNHENTNAYGAKRLKHYQITTNTKLRINEKKNS